jgi:oligopeptide/dipeptide ABC transporter ATP-binding protein
VTRGAAPADRPPSAEPRSLIEPDGPLLDVDGLVVELPAAAGRRPAVDGVRFVLAAGEGVALVGESGSGKTQLARALLGLTPESGRVRGRVRHAGRDLLTLTEGEWNRVRGRRIGMVFQEPASALDPVRTLGAHLAEAIRLHRRATDHEVHRLSLEALSAVAFPDPESGLEAFAHRLSGGLRQRACLAIALAPGPDVLVADEPTASLDATVALQILQLLDRLRSERGLAVLLITHDLGLVARHCDRVLVLYAGRIVEEAAVADLFRAPAHPYTRGLLGAVPRLDAAARRRGERYSTIAGLPPDLASRPSGACAFAPRCPERFDPCDRREPELYPAGASRARCFLHEPGRELAP